MTVKEVQQEVIKELGIDLSIDTIRRDGNMELVSPSRADNNYRDYNDFDVTRIKLITLLRDVGIPRGKISIILKGDTTMLWERVKRLTFMTIPTLKEYLNEITSE